MHNIQAADFNIDALVSGSNYRNYYKIVQDIYDSFYLSNDINDHTRIAKCKGFNASVIDHTGAIDKIIEPHVFDHLLK